MDELIPAKEEIGEALSDAVTADARVGACPVCGKDLLMRVSAKTRSSFIGCSGWPDCDITYPVPQGKIEPQEELCATCGKPQIKVTPFRSKPHVVCVDPQCPTNVEPDVKVGECAACKAAGIHGELIAQKNPRTLKRFIRCTNYETCNTSYPLPQRGKLTATDRVCEACGAPKVIVTTNRGPWELCPNPACPLREEKEQAKAAKAAAGGAKAAKGTKAAKGAKGAKGAAGGTKAAKATKGKAEKGGAAATRKSPAKAKAAGATKP
jgi:DNA topoisomerase-1